MTRKWWIRYLYFKNGTKCKKSTSHEHTGFEEFLMLEGELTDP
jgi:anti-sigma factor ChrR (cupin superfamily)